MFKDLTWFCKHKTTIRKTQTDVHSIEHSHMSFFHWQIQKKMGTHSLQSLPQHPCKNSWEPSLSPIKISRLIICSQLATSTSNGCWTPYHPSGTSSPEFGASTSGFFAEDAQLGIGPMGKCRRCHRFRKLKRKTHIVRRSAFGLRVRKYKDPFFKGMRWEEICGCWCVCVQCVTYDVCFWFASDLLRPGASETQFKDLSLERIQMNTSKLLTKLFFFFNLYILLDF